LQWFFVALFGFVGRAKFLFFCGFPLVPFLAGTCEFLPWPLMRASLPQSRSFPVDFLIPRPGCVVRYLLWSPTSWARLILNFATPKFPSFDPGWPPFSPPPNFFKGHFLSPPPSSPGPGVKLLPSSPPGHPPFSGIHPT